MSKRTACGWLGALVRIGLMESMVAFTSTRTNLNAGGNDYGTELSQPLGTVPRSPR
jgi:hypothetical protein